MHVNKVNCFSVWLFAELIVLGMIHLCSVCNYLTDVVRNGYACDGGMFMPVSIPKQSEETLQSWKDLSYPDIVKKIAQIFIEDEIPQETLSGKHIQIELTTRHCFGLSLHTFLSTMILMAYRNLTEYLWDSYSSYTLSHNTL